MPVTLISYNRPLTRSARRDLADYGIISEDAVNDFGHWTEVEVEEEPPADLLARHELRVDRDPDVIYRTDTGSEVLIYTDSVIVDGTENTISPEEAKEHAEANGWEKVEGDE